MTCQLCFAGLSKQQDEIEFVEGDFLADVSGTWENPMTWKKYDGTQFSAYGVSGIPDGESTAYIQGQAGAEVLITCNQSQEIKSLIVLTYGGISLNQTGSPIIFSIFGDLTSAASTLINSNRVRSFTS